MTTVRKKPIVLPKSQMLQVLMPEEVPLCAVQMVVRVHVIWVGGLVLWFPHRPTRCIGHELCMMIFNRDGRTHHVKVQQPIVRHAQADRSSFEDELHTVSLVDLGVSNLCDILSR